MSGSNRGQLFTIVTFIFIAVVSVTIWAGAYDIGRSISRNNSAEQYYATSYAKDSTKKINETSLDFSTSFKIAACIRETIESEHEQKRDEKDLKAQTEMARWALHIVIISVFSAITTSAGVWFVAKTLQETQRATKAAQSAVEVTSKIGEAQTKAYVGVTNCLFSLNDQIAKITIEFINSGNTPAYIIQSLAKAGVVQGNEGRHGVGPRLEFLVDGNSVKIIEPTIPSHNLFSNKGFEISIELNISQDEKNAIIDGSSHLFVTGGVIYTDVFNRVWVANFQFINGGSYGYVSKGNLHPSKYNEPEFEKKST